MAHLKCDWGECSNIIVDPDAMTDVDVEEIARGEKQVAACDRCILLAFVYPPSYETPDAHQQRTGHPSYRFNYDLARAVLVRRLKRDIVGTDRVLVIAVCTTCGVMTERDE